MQQCFRVLIGFMLIIHGFSCDDDSDSVGMPEEKFELEVFKAQPIKKSNSTKLYVHYMPWFETKSSADNGQWGYHWTMGHSNPDIMDSNGNWDIASHYHPLIGPYHSGDASVIEYHLLLMKYAGIDGLLIDWYGTYQLNDYAINHQNTLQLIELIDKVGLDYAFVYEDRFLDNIVNAQLAASPTEAAIKDMTYLREQHFSKENYIKQDQKPLLMVFGPITLESPGEWETVFSQSQTSPFFITLWNESQEASGSAHGEYAWIYKDQNALEGFYNNRVKELDFAMGSAYVGFEDFYTEAGVDAGIDWEIPPLNGNTFKETLALFESTGLGYLQLITWNDFGEGTMIEPTKELGFGSLEILHEFAGVSLSKEVLYDCHQLYELRKLYLNEADIQLQLDQAFYFLISLQPDKAKTIMNTFKNNS